MTAVDHGTTESLPLELVVESVELLRDGYGARVGWLGLKDGVYRVRIGKHILTFNDLDAAGGWAYQCQGYASSHYKEHNTPTFVAYAFENGARWHGKPIAVYV